MEINLGKFKHLDKDKLKEDAAEFEAYTKLRGGPARERVFDPKDKSKVVLTYFSEDRINMCRAVLDHKPLCAATAHLNPETDWEQILAEIAAYCNVVLDGSYVPSDMEQLYKELFMRLTVMPVRMDYADYINPTLNQEDFDPATWDKFLKPKKVIVK